MALKKTPENIEIPFGYELRPQKRTRRLQLLTIPAIYDELKRIADNEGVSVNELCNDIFMEYLKERGKT